jgi:aminoglycoside phosphotransferase (APT) family kinase protein
MEWLCGLQQELSSRNIVLQPDSLAENPVQGIGVTTYVAKSDQGDLIVQLGTMDGQARHRKPWQQISLASELLRDFPDIPVAEVILAMDREDRYLVVQRKIDGEVMAPDAEISDDVKERIEEMIARIHNVRVAGSGDLVKRDAVIQGSCASWREFLDKEVGVWLEALERTEGFSMAGKIREHYDQNKCLLDIASSLTHGDLFNLSNFILKDGAIVGIIDWEFAMAGDPAWEFCLSDKYSLKRYFSLLAMNDKEQAAFLQRARIYTPLALARLMSLNAPQDREYQDCRARLERMGFA